MHSTPRLIAAALLLGMVPACTQSPSPAPTQEDVPMAEDPKVAVVLDMIEAWNDREWNRIADLFTEDGVLHSVMLEPITGREAIRTRIVGMGEGISDIKLNVRNIGRVGDVVFVERVDEFTYKGHAGKVPVVGVLQVEGDKVSEWREYYDRAELIEAMGLEQDFDPGA